MILTFTANPSIDTTLSLDVPLERGGVLRPQSARRSAGGKGINVAHTLRRANVPTLAIFPSAEHDPFVALIESADIPYENVAIDGYVRTNTAITEPDGTTTKFNEPGPTLSDEHLRQLEDLLVHRVTKATALVLSGSLPPGAPVDWYATLVVKCRQAHPDIFIAVDTSDEPLDAIVARLNECAPTLLKPNGAELGQLTGINGEDIEYCALRGDFAPALAACQPLIAQGVDEILLTLGSAGALLITANQAWCSLPPPTHVVSTVGAGDCSLAGYLRARVCEDDRSAALRWAVAYGSAATGLPGTEIPSLDQVNFDQTTVREIPSPKRDERSFSTIPSSGKELA